MKHCLLSTGTKPLAKANPFDPVWGIGFRADDPEAQDPSRWRGKSFLGKALPAVHYTLRACEAGLQHPVPSRQFCTPTTPDRVHYTSPAPPRPLAVARACPGPPLAFSTCFSDAPADHSPEVVSVVPNVDPPLALSEHGPCLVGGTIIESRFTAELASSPFWLCGASRHWLSTYFFIRRDGLGRVLSVGAASILCEHTCAPCSWGGGLARRPL